VGKAKSGLELTVRRSDCLCGHHALFLIAALVVLSAWRVVRQSLGCRTTSEFRDGPEKHARKLDKRM